MTAQASVVTKQPRAFAGLQDGTAENVIESAINEGATEVPFGTMVADGTAFDQFESLGEDDVNTTPPRGVLVHSHQFQQDNQLGSTGLKRYVVAGIMVRGRIWVPVDAAVVSTDAVRYYGELGGAAAVGTFTKTLEAGETVNISSFAQWKAYDSGTGLGLLQFDMTDKAGRVAD